jgi:hypothetical protein
MKGIFSRNTYCCMCHYPAVFGTKYLLIPSSVSVSIGLYFYQKYIRIHADPAGRDARLLFQINAALRLNLRQPERPRVPALQPTPQQPRPLQPPHRRRRQTRH